MSDKDNQTENAEQSGSAALLCCKCQSSTLNSKYIPDGKLIDSSSLKRVSNEFVRSREYRYFFQLTAAKEHLHMTCRNCGYQWRKNSGQPTRVISD